VRNCVFVLVHVYTFTPCVCVPLHFVTYRVTFVPRAMLRSASLNPAGVTVTYIPCPQGYVPTIATGQAPTEQSQLSNPGSPDIIGKLVCTDSSLYSYMAVF